VRQSKNESFSGCSGQQLSHWACANRAVWTVKRIILRSIHSSGCICEEVVVKGSGEAGSNETESAVRDGWISVKAVDDEIAINALRTSLGFGESEVIILCKELGVDYALIDERAARYKAELMDVKTMGVLGIIDLAIEMGFAIDKEKFVKRLREVGFRISDRLYRKMFPDFK